LVSNFLVFMQNILITGGTGLVGQVLTQEFLEKKYQISYLSRSKKSIPNVNVFKWSYKENFLEENTLKNVDAIIHLAGAGVADKSWTTERKKEILESRTLTTKLLFDKLKAMQNPPKIFIAASAIGIYGDTGDKLIDENSPVKDDFLAEVTKKWEAEIDKIKSLGIRVVKIRIGVVLSANGGALEKLAQPIKLGAGAPLASGKQYMSWIHVKDLARIFIFALENENIKGAYNGVAPNPVTNKEMTELTAKVLRKPLWLPNVPEFALKMMLGEMASIVITGSKISSEKIEKAGFEFHYKKAEDALYDLLK